MNLTYFMDVLLYDRKNIGYLKTDSCKTNA